MLKYSTVIPAHNEASSIAGAITSVLAQSLAPKEVIVVDDGSTDATVQLAKRFDGVRVVQHGRCRGPSQARNAGVWAACSEWVAFLDADDTWDREKIERQASVAKSEGAGLVYCGVRVLREHGDKPKVREASLFSSHRRLCRELLLRNCVTGSDSAVLVRKVLLEEAGLFDPRLSAAEDWDMWLRLAHITEFAAVKRPLVTLVSRIASLGSDPNRIFEGGRLVLQKNAHYYSNFRDAKLLRRRGEARLYERRGIGYFSQRRYDLARRDLAHATAIWPFRLHSLVPLIKLCTGMIQQQ